jgi:YggT family protein
MFAYILNLLFTVYTLMLLVRVVGSWFPAFASHRVMHFLGFYTDPYLNFFRRIIPPLGVIDLSPMIAFLALQVLQTLVFLLIR